MSTPFLKKDKTGICLKLHTALYGHDAIEQFRGAYGDGLTFVKRGAYWILSFADALEEDVVDSLDSLLVLSRNRKK